MKNTEARHICLTPLQIKTLFDTGHLRPSGYLYLLLGSLKKHGWQHRIESVEEFCNEWGFSRSAFYRAKAKLTLQNLLQEDILGGVILKTSEVSLNPTVPLDDEAVPLSETEIPPNETSVPLSGISIPLSETEIPDLGKQSLESLSTQRVQASLNSSSDLYTDLYSSLSQAIPKKEECSSPLIYEEIDWDPKKKIESSNNESGFIANQNLLISGNALLTICPPPTLSPQINSVSQFENLFVGGAQLKTWVEDKEFLTYLSTKIIDGKKKDRGFVLGWLKNRVKNKEQYVVEGHYEEFLGERATLSSLAPEIDLQLEELKAGEGRGYNLSGLTYEEALENLAWYKSMNIEPSAYVA
jgi:hypothetical protein